MSVFICCLNSQSTLGVAALDLNHRRLSTEFQKDNEKVEKEEEVDAQKIVQERIRATKQIAKQASVKIEIPEESVITSSAPSPVPSGDKSAVV